MNDVRSEFIVESREHLAVFERSLLALEKASAGIESRSFIQHGLRAIHSLKGDSGFLGLATIRELAHAMESLLEDYRDGVHLPSSSVVEALLAARDRLAVLVEDLDRSEHAAADDLIERLHRLEGAASQDIHFDIHLDQWLQTHPEMTLAGLFEQLDAMGSVQQPQLTGLPEASTFCSDMWAKKCNVRFSGTLSTRISRDAVAALICDSPVQPMQIQKTGFREKTGHSERRINLGEWQKEHPRSLIELFREIDAAGELFDQRLVFSPTDLSVGLPTEQIIWQALQVSAERATNAGSSEVETPLNSRVESKKATTLDDRSVRTESAAGVDRSLTPNRSASNSEAERLRSLRINVELLDRLMNLVGELTLVRNQTQVTFAEQEGETRNLIQRLNSVTSELQDTVLQTRMQPAGNLFGRFPRMVRDLARQLGKEVEVETVGQEVELDKTVLERLSDPLTHLIRNSIDHGLELPEIREAAGKPRVGRIVLSATPKDGQVYIEIRDDGRGIDPMAVKSKAAAMGLRTESELDRMSHRELLSLILLPGFSTAKKVTDVSGRGVGMDVVKTNVEELEGHLTIDSSPGRGTSMVLRVPLTLAIVPCLIVTVGDDRFAVPQRELEEIVCLHPGSRRSLEHAFETEVFRLRDALLPVIRFSEVLARRQSFSAADKAEILAKHPTTERESGKIEYILVLRSGGKRFGLLVDDVQGREEIVVKPMHSSMRRLTIFSGATLMGDGRVALIANVEGIIEHAKYYFSSADEIQKPAVRNPHEVHRVLLFEYGPSEQFALPLVQVRRVELLDMARIERVGEREFITIDGQSTRILRLDEMMNVSSCEESVTKFLILPRFVPEPMGILAHRIVDTESLAIELQSSGDIHGVLGTAIVRSRLSLFLDVQQLREFAFGSDRSDRASDSAAFDAGIGGAQSPFGDDRRSDPATQRVLLVDDMSFFREIVRRYLAADTIEIVTAVDGRDGLEQLARQDFDLVVSDIEMPNMDGWQFCREARAKGYRMPFLALTSLAKIENEQRALAYGFDDFEEKLDHDRLKRKVLHWLERSLERKVPQ